MVLKAAVQALQQAEPLKLKVQRCKDILNDNDAWLCQRQLQRIYHQVLILDLEYALDRKVEQELWSLGFKNYIGMLQAQARNPRNPKRIEVQDMLSWCLDAASGFYLTLLQEICTAFNLDLPFRRKGYVYGYISPWKAVEKLTPPLKSSCFYACQYCLVHLGDIARYRSQNKQAELFYRHAVLLSPSSGQPYNQLALLETSRGDKLSTVFHYVRAIAVKHPFPVALTNLAVTLSSVLNDTSFKVEGKTKLSSQEFITVFLKLHAVTFTLQNLSMAATYVKLLNETLTALVATESFSSWRLVQMLVVNLYALQHTPGVPNDCTDLIKIEQMNSEEKLSRDCILDLIAGNLSALLLPVYTIKNSIVNYFALPSIKLCLDWIQMRPKILEETAFTSRLQIWPSLCVLLNGLQNCVIDFDYNQYSNIPLPEDHDLRGFLPFEKSFEALQFRNIDFDSDTAILNKVRAMRILKLGRELAKHTINGAALISLNAEEQTFIAATQISGVSCELMKELEELSLNKDKQPLIASPVPSETASSKGSSEIDSLITEVSLEKRGGILKPQGSLERNRDGGEVTPTTETQNSTPTIGSRRPRKNVAMQAIMRRNESEQKQVTFKNISPVEVSKVPTSVVNSTVKVSNAKNTQTSLASTNGITLTSAATVQPRPPLMPNTPLTIKQNPPVQQKQPQELQTHILQQQNPQSQLEQQTKAEKNINHSYLTQQQQQQKQPQQLQSSQSQQLPQQIQQPLQRENTIHPPPVNNQFSISEQMSQSQLQTAAAPPNLNQYPHQPPQNSLPNFPNQSFNIQAQQQFNKSIIPQQQQPLTHPPQFTPAQFSRLSIRMQHKLLQEHRSSFGGIDQSNTMLNQALNLAPTSQQQQSIGQNRNSAMQQTSLSMHPQNLMPGAHPSNGLNLPNHLHMPTQSNLGYQDTSIPNSSEYAVFNQNSYNPLQVTPSAYVNGQHFSYPNQNKNQPQQNAFAMLHSFEAKDYNPWKELQTSTTWWNSNGGPMMQGFSKDLPVIPGTEHFHGWTAPTQTGQHVNNIPLSTPGNNYSQGRLYGRNNFEDMRQFDLDQKQQQHQQQAPAISNTYSLFSGNSWGVNGQLSSNISSSQQDQMKTRLNQQSLWSGPGPSPLERLLEQQKSLREGGT